MSQKEVHFIHATRDDIMKFLALDFETANYYRDSACALGLVRVENNKIIDKESFLIRPPYKVVRILPISTELLGRCRECPTFKQHWKSINPFFKGIDFAVAHNATFHKVSCVAVVRGQKFYA